MLSYLANNLMRVVRKRLLASAAIHSVGYSIGLDLATGTLEARETRAIFTADAAMSSSPSGHVGSTLPVRRIVAPTTCWAPPPTGPTAPSPLPRPKPKCDHEDGYRYE